MNRYQHLGANKNGLQVLSSTIRGLILTAILSIFVENPEVHANETFKVRSLDGDLTVLSTLFEPGKWTLVMIWTTYCGVCKDQFPLLEAFHSAHQSTDAVVVGIALDGYDHIDKIAAHIAENAISFPNFVGELPQISPSVEEATGERFDGTPTYLLFNAEGAIMAFKVGPIRLGEIERFIEENPS